MKVNSAGNLPPNVAIVSPTNGAVLDAPATLTVEASATDNDGAISQVEFFDGAALMYVATNSPYRASVTNLTSGSYTFSAVATDNHRVWPACCQLVSSAPRTALTSTAASTST